MKLIVNMLVIIAYTVVVGVSLLLAGIWFLPIAIYTLAKYLADNDKYAWQITEEDRDEIAKHPNKYLRK
jgi:hypothetical protein